MDKGQSEASSHPEERPPLIERCWREGGRPRLMLMRPRFVFLLQPEYKYVDPICTFLFSILVLGTTLTILRDVILVLMEGNLDLRTLGWVAHNLRLCVETRACHPGVFFSRILLSLNQGPTV